jgi:hypothetical protein
MRRLTILSVICLALGLAAKSQAALETFSLSYSGASFGNSATGTGTITFDPTLINNPGFTILSPTAFSITISGATSAADDGTFGLADFSEIFLDTGGATLDFSKQLFGQSPFDSNGDFNVFSNGSNPLAPTGVDPFTIGTADGEGDRLLLTSFAPAAGGGGSSAPLPSGLTLGLLCLGTLVFAVRRNKLNAC